MPMAPVVRPAAILMPRLGSPLASLPICRLSGGGAQDTRCLQKGAPGVARRPPLEQGAAPVCPAVCSD